MSESRIHYVITKGDERNLSPHELRIYATRAVVQSVLLFLLSYGGLTWLLFFPLNVGILQTYVVPMGALLIHPKAVINAIANLAPFMALLCWIKVGLIAGGSIGLVVMAFRTQWVVVDGYKHIAGRRYLKNPVQAEQTLITELNQSNPDFRKYPEKLGMVVDGKFQFSNALLGGHMIVPGPPGSGKTAFLARILKEIVQDPNAFLVVHDNKGDMTSMLPLELCQILAPWDERASPLLIGRDINNKVLAAEFAAATIQEDKNNKFFTDSARQIREGLILKLQHDKGNHWTFQDLLKLELLPCLEMKKWIDIFNPIAGHYLADPEGKMTSSILSTLASSAKTIQQLAEAYAGKDITKDGFSVRRWLMTIAMAGKVVTAPNGKSKTIKPPKKRILILQSNANYSQLSQGYIKTVLSIMSNTMNSPDFTEDPNRKIFLLLDEFPQLGKLENFKPFLETGRSKGIKVILAFQSYNQLYELYGERDGKAILDTANHSIYLGGNSKEAVKEICDLLGKRTVFSKKWSDNQNAQGASYNLTDSTEQIPIILESEIQADFGARKDGVYALVNLARTDYVYRICFPYLTHAWGNNPPFILADWVTGKSPKLNSGVALKSEFHEPELMVEEGVIVAESRTMEVTSVSQVLSVANGHGEVLDVQLDEMMEQSAEVAFDMICHDAASLCHAMEYIDVMMASPMNDNATGVVDQPGEEESRSTDRVIKPVLQRGW